MSDRGSFCTEFIYCGDCFSVVKKRFIDENENDKILTTYQIPSWVEGEFLPIIAGKIGSLTYMMDYETIETMCKELEPLLCSNHSVRIAVITESNGERFYRIPAFQHAIDI